MEQWENPFSDSNIDKHHKGYLLRIWRHGHNNKYKENHYRLNEEKIYNFKLGVDKGLDTELIWNIRTDNLMPTLEWELNILCK